jgi:hypothetical protein
VGGCNHGTRFVEAAYSTGIRCLAEDLPEQPSRYTATHDNGQLLPLGVVDERPRDRSIEVLDSATTWLCPDKLDVPEIAQDARMVAHGGQRRVELSGERDRTRLASIGDDLQNPQAQRMPECLYQCAIDGLAAAHRAVAR